MSGHVCTETVNPRHAGYCACGKKLTPGRSRDRVFERELTERLVAGLSVDPHPLVVFAERRADRAQVDYGHDFPSLERDLELEASEELADCRNYLVWRLEAIHRGLCEGGDRVEHLQAALRYVALAFGEVQRAR